MSVSEYLQLAECVYVRLSAEARRGYWVTDDDPKPAPRKSQAAEPHRDASPPLEELELPVVRAPPPQVQAEPVDSAARQPSRPVTRERKKPPRAATPPPPSPPSPPPPQRTVAPVPQRRPRPDHNAPPEVYV